MSDDFYDDDPFFLVSDRLDAGENPKNVYAWAKAQRAKVRDQILREQWAEALRYIREENPGVSFK
ncbi:MAG: hypothetical protein ACI361_09310 [Atopobiaceae bacterium]